MLVVVALVGFAGAEGCFYLLFLETAADPSTSVGMTVLVWGDWRSSCGDEPG